MREKHPRGPTPSTIATHEGRRVLSVFNQERCVELRNQDSIVSNGIPRYTVPETPQSLTGVLLG